MTPHLPILTPREDRGEARRRFISVVRTILPSDTTSSTPTATIETSGAGIEILSGGSAGMTLTFRTKGDDALEATETRQHQITGEERGIIAEEFDSIVVEWGSQPHDFGPVTYQSSGSDLQERRPLVVRIWHHIRTVPVQTAQYVGARGSFIGLVRGSVTIGANALQTIYSDELVTTTIPGFGDRWSFDEQATPFMRLHGWVNSVDTDEDWQVIVSGLSGDAVANLQPVYEFKPQTRLPIHTAGGWSLVMFGATSTTNDAGTGSTIGFPCPPGGFAIQIFNGAIANRDFHFAIGASSGW